MWWGRTAAAVFFFFSRLANVSEAPGGLRVHVDAFPPQLTFFITPPPSPPGLGGGPPSAPLLPFASSSAPSGMRRRSAVGVSESILASRFMRARVLSQEMETGACVWTLLGRL